MPQFVLKCPLESFEPSILVILEVFGSKEKVSTFALFAKNTSVQDFMTHERF